MRVRRFPISLRWNPAKGKWDKVFFEKWKWLRTATEEQAREAEARWTEQYHPVENPLDHIGKDVYAWAYIIPQGYVLSDVDPGAEPEKYGITGQGVPTLRGQHYLTPAWAGASNDAGRVPGIDLRTPAAGCAVWYGALPPVVQVTEEFQRIYTGAASAEVKARRAACGSVGKHHHLVPEMASMARRGLSAEEIARIQRDAAGNHECEDWQGEADKAVETFGPKNRGTDESSEEPEHQNWDSDTRRELRLLLKRPLKGDLDYEPTTQARDDEAHRGRWQPMKEAIQRARAALLAPAYLQPRCASLALDGRRCRCPGRPIPTSRKERDDEVSERWKLGSFFANWGGFFFGSSDRLYLYELTLDHEKLTSRTRKEVVADAITRSFLHMGAVARVVARAIGRMRRKGSVHLLPGPRQDVLLFIADAPPDEMFKARVEGLRHVKTFIVVWDPQKVEGMLNKLVDTVRTYSQDDPRWWDNALTTYWHKQTNRRIRLGPQDRIEFPDPLDRDVSCRGGQYHENSTLVEGWDVEAHDEPLGKGAWLAELQAWEAEMRWRFPELEPPDPPPLPA